MSESAIQFFAPDAPALARRLWQKLEKLKSEKEGQLRLARDWADVRYRIGVVDGLQLAITECIEAEKELDR